MTEEELKKVAAELADLLKGCADLTDVEYIDEGDLQGEPASICFRYDGNAYVFGLLPV